VRPRTWCAQASQGKRGWIKRPSGTVRGFLVFQALRARLPSERPSGTVRGFLVFQALRARLLSERPSGTVRGFLVFQALRAGLPSERPSGTVRGFLIFQALRARLPSERSYGTVMVSYASAPGRAWFRTPVIYLHWAPPAFVQPFHEKLRRRVDYGGQAGDHLRHCDVYKLSGCHLAPSLQYIAHFSGALRSGPMGLTSTV
jgi:hypothetical protein